MVALQIGQMRSLFVVCQMRPSSVRHCEDEVAIIHVQPITSTNELILSIPRERAIWFGAKVENGLRENQNSVQRFMRCAMGSLQGRTIDRSSLSFAMVLHTHLT